jgi:RNA polymerase sigma factor (sigma-70 family)
VSVDPEFDEVFRSTYPAVAAAAFRVLGDRAAAEDVAAEAFARMYARWGRIRRLEWREAWVMRVGINLAIDQRRRRPPAVDAPAGLDVDEYVSHKATLAGALDRLPRRQRSVVALRYLAGFSTSEVADHLGLAEGTVRIHLGRALRRLRVDLGEEA